MTRHLTPTAGTHHGVQRPRAHRQQRGRLTAGRGTRSAPGFEHRANPTRRDSYLRLVAVGHVVVAVDPARHLTVAAHHTPAGAGHVSCRPRHDRHEVWRPYLPTGHLPTRGAR